MNTVRNRLRSILASLVIFLSSAPTYAITYNINVVEDGNTVTGTITTNGHLGVLSATDITQYDLVMTAGVSVGFMIGMDTPIFTGSPLIAGSTILVFVPQNGSAEFFQAGNIWFLNSSSAFPPFGAMDFVVTTGSGFVEHLVMLSPDFQGHTDFQIGSADFTPPVTTPLPAALPLFATGLGALGLLGRSRKKKAAAAAA